MSTNLNALVTDAGLAAASVAKPDGPYIQIVKFKIGTGYGYTPSRHDTGLNGTIVHEAAVTSYQHIPPKTLNVRCRLDPLVGPFEFGELGLYLPNDVLFAKVVFPKLQLKTSSLMTRVAASYTFNCLIKLEQSVAIFDITTDCGPDIWYVDKWSDVMPPRVPIVDGVHAVLVAELDKHGRSSLLHYSNNSKWTLGTTYGRYVASTVVSGSTSQITLDSTPFPELDESYVLSAGNRDFVLELPGGYFRSVSSVARAGTHYRFNLNPDNLSSPLPVGTSVIVHHDATLKISPDEGNRIERRNNGIGVWDKAPPDLENQYVSNSGNDANEGTKAKPLRTIDEALRRIPSSNGGEFIIHLKANHSFVITKRYNLNGSLRITVYDDPIYGDYETPEYNPLGLATNASRAILNFSPYLGSTGLTYPSGVDTVGGILIKGISMATDDSSTGYTPRVHLRSSGGEIRFWGCNVIVKPLTYAGAAQKVGSTHTYWDLAENGFIGFEAVSVADLANRPYGSVVPGQGGLPSWTVRGTNVQAAAGLAKINNNNVVWNDATQSLYGVVVNWNPWNPQPPS